MDIYWNTRNLPELSGLTPAQQEVALTYARNKTVFKGGFILMILIMLAIPVFLAFGMFFFTVLPQSNFAPMLAIWLMIYLLFTPINIHFLRTPLRKYTQTHFKHMSDNCPLEYVQTMKRLKLQKAVSLLLFFLGLGLAGLSCTVAESAIYPFYAITFPASLLFSMERLEGLSSIDVFILMLVVSLWNGYFLGKLASGLVWVVQRRGKQRFDGGVGTR